MGALFGVIEKVLIGLVESQKKLWKSTGIAAPLLFKLSCHSTSDCKTDSAEKRKMLII